MKKKILMVCYGGGHVTIIEPLYQHLKSKYSVTILALTMAATYLKKKNIPYVTFYDFKEFFPPQVAEYGKVLTKSMGHNDQIRLEDSIYYMGCSYFDLVTRLGEDKANACYALKGRGIFYPEGTLNRIISVLSPDVVVTTNAPRAERAALSAAKKHAIPTLCINDGIWIEGGTSGVLDIANDRLANTICVLSEAVKENILKRTTSVGGNIVVTGTPVFDSVMQTKRRASNDGIPRILFADCSLPEYLPQYPEFTADPTFGDRVRSKLNELAGKYQWIVYFRPHPNQEVDYSKYKHIKISDSSDPLHARLANSDVVVTNISTVGVEGKAMGLGLVSLEGTVYNRFNSFNALGMSSPVFDEEDLYPAIIKELDNLNSNFVLYDGVAVHNISVEIERLLYSSLVDNK